MNDTERTRRPSTRSSRRSGGSTQLGELEFSDWYEIPVFEPDEDERTEEMATAGRGPRSLMARARIARDARRAHRGPQWDSPAPRAATQRPAAAEESAPAPATPKASAPAPAPAPAPASPKAAAPKADAAPKVDVPAAAPAAVPAEPKAAAAKPAPEPAPAPKQVTAEPKAATPKAATPKAATPKAATPKAATAKPAPEPAPAPKQSPAAARTTAPEPAVSDADTWVTSGPALTEESMQQDLERESVWRRRFNNFLDRWAASEMAVAHRLDDSLERVISPKAVPELISTATKRGESD